MRVRAIVFFGPHIESANREFSVSAISTELKFLPHFAD